MKTWPSFHRSAEIQPCAPMFWVETAPPQAMAVAWASAGSASAVSRAAPAVAASCFSSYRTPVAALLERAHRRMEADGWCAGTLTNEDGAVCLLGAIRGEAAGDRGLEADAARVVLEAIRRRFGDDVDSVPGFNDSWESGHAPLRMLNEAASLADAKGL
ncbi:DUF6197 family protein [Streptomyces sp. NPDC054794]